MKTLIEMHILQNFAPSNLNRDDTGAPKDALFGGSRRARISSQCLKRAVRQYFKQQVSAGSLAVDAVGVRSKRLLDSLAERLVRNGRSESDARIKAKTALSSLELGVKDDGKTEYLLFLGEREISELANVIHEKWDLIVENKNSTDESKKPGKAKKKAASNADPQLLKAMQKVIDGGKALDIALFGRMLADMPEMNQDAACQVAHALSTHAVEREFDFYTAVDDLKPEDTAGADMLGTVEFNSACFYRYAAVDWDKFLDNLQHDKELAKQGLRLLLQGFVTAEPTGKQNTFAAHNPPEFISITVKRDEPPRNLANAFETALTARKSESITRISAEALARKAIVLDAAFNGANERAHTYVLNIIDAQIEGYGKKVGSLHELVDSVLAAL